MKDKQPVVHVCSVQLDINSEVVKLNYQPFNKEIELLKLDATVRACDESLLSRDGYRRLAAVEPQLIREYQVAARRIEITNLMNEKIKIESFSTDEVINNQPSFKQSEIKNGVYRSINSILSVLVPIWKQSSPPTLVSGDTIRLKLGGDGHNVGRKQNHVMMTICLLNE
ncbi:11763_t:CDS:1, partial [Cetraspora pellucida]